MDFFSWATELHGQEPGTQETIWQGVCDTEVVTKLQFGLHTLGQVPERTPISCKQQARTATATATRTATATTTATASKHMGLGPEFIEVRTAPKFGRWVSLHKTIKPTTFGPKIPVGSCRWPLDCLKWPKFFLGGLKWAKKGAKNGPK